MNKTSELRTESDQVITERSGDILTITLNRPDSGNSLSTGVIAELQRIFDQSADDKSLHVIVLAARGRIFCAGHDLRELRDDNSAAFAKRLATVCNRMMQTILRLPQPVIASVQGVATAAGCQLVATCDLAVASTEARFATPGVNIGTWCSTPMVALSRAVHRKHAMQLLLTGRLHDAEAALRMGLVNEVVAPDALASATARLASEIAAKSPYAIALGKSAFYRQIELGISDAYEYASELASRNSTASDAREGVSAFLEKRAPKWHGR
ncbi:MAG: enoyl-CoA hydratase [Burkholderiaceae bacterium]|nr:enoyl-CoA hydratase [Burkholderiaceae bacterium]